MKYIARISLPAFLAAAALCSSGCLLNYVEDAVTSKVYRDPAAWVPRVSDEDGNPIDAGVKVVSREMKVGDPVTVKITVNLRQGAPVDDVIDDEGNISLPIIGEFKIIGMTTADAERAIRQAYIEQKVYSNCTVSVLCRAAQAAAEASYSITGAIHKRGRYPLKSGMTLWQALIAAGDVSDFAGDKITITRGGIKKSFSYRRIKNGRIQDPVLYNGDIIEVPD
jgi:polysaccharide export outer membrane protein